MENKKNLGIYIYKILKEESDENHRLQFNDIISILKDKYGIVAGRNAIGRNIDSLIGAGFYVEKTSKGVYLGERDFEDSEVEYLIDSVYSSKSLPSGFASELVGKLCKNFSKFKQNRFEYLFSSNGMQELNRSLNKQVFYSIDLLSEAISKGVQVEFTYNQLGFDKKLTPKKEHSYVVNPYFMLNNNGKYYLVGNYNKYYNLSHYRIDYITDLKLLDNKAKPATSLFGYENGIDKFKYANEHIYMFGGNSVDAELLVNNIDALSAVFDWFGLDLEVEQKEDKFLVKLHTNENALFYWVIQYGENVELMSPKILRNKLSKFSKMLFEKYND